MRILSTSQDAGCETSALLLVDNSISCLLKILNSASIYLAVNIRLAPYWHLCIHRIVSTPAPSLFPLFFQLIDLGRPKINHNFLTSQSTPQHPPPSIAPPRQHNPHPTSTMAPTNIFHLPSTSILKRSCVADDGYVCYHVPIPAIIGIVLGVAFFLLALGLTVFICVKVRRATYVFFSFLLSVGNCWVVETRGGCVRGGERSVRVRVNAKQRLTPTRYTEGRGNSPSRTAWSAEKWMRLRIGEKRNPRRLRGIRMRIDVMR